MAKQRLALAPQWLGHTVLSAIIFAPFSTYAACSVQRTVFGELSTGASVDAYTVHNGSLNVTVLTLGGILYSVEAPDRNGQMANVVRTLDSVHAYERSGTFSSIVGRYAGRISQGGFNLDGVRHTLASNSHGISIHGGSDGFGTRVWTAHPGICSVTLSLVSEDGEGGFPGRLWTSVTYEIDKSSLTLRYVAKASKPTVVNLTHHAYFNLSDSPTVHDHLLTVKADHWLPNDLNRIPTGEVAPVSGLLDLRQPRRVGDVALSDRQQIIMNKGLDHTFIVSGAPAVTLKDPVSGRVLKVSTTEPDIVIFSAINFTGAQNDANKQPLMRGGGLALETQHFPDSPNNPHFPTTILRPGQTYRSTTTFYFSVD